MANAPVPATANINIKLPVGLKLQLREQTCTLVFLQKNLINLTIHFFIYRIEKSHNAENIFKFKNYFFSTVNPIINKLDAGITVTYFSELQEPVLELQKNSITLYW